MTNPSTAPIASPSASTTPATHGASQSLGSAPALGHLNDHLSDHLRDLLCDVAHLFYERGWSVGTSSNYSVKLSHDPLRLLITASGRDKRRLNRRDFVVVDGTGAALDPPGARPSAETLLHVVAAECREVGAVLHTHSIWGTLLSDLYFPQGGLWIDDYEMLKGLSGVTTHQTRVWVEIFDNTQDIASLATVVRQRLADAKNPLRHAFLMRNHGLYTWGKDLEEARRHVEILEFLFELVGRRRSMAAI